MATGIITTTERGVDLVVEWMINDFFTLPVKDGAWYVSPVFSFGGEDWFLRIYPNGWSGRDSSGHVHLSLYKWCSNRSIRLSFSLSLKTAKGEKNIGHRCTKDFGGKDNRYHEFNRFISRSKLSRRRSELVPQNVLTVVCTMKSTTSTKSDTESADRSPARSDSASASPECCHCKRTFDSESLSTHQKKCMQRPIKCPDCLKVVLLQKWLDEHECQKMRPENYNCREKLLMVLCIASILIAVVTGCILAYSKTPISSSHSSGGVETKIQIPEINKPINRLEVVQSNEFDASGSNETGAADIKQAERVNKTAELTLIAEPNAEMNNVDQSEIAGSDISQASVANQADTSKSDESEGINKTLAAEMNKTDKSEITGSDIPEASAAKQADTAEKDESEPLPQPVLMVTQVGSTYLEVVWILPEESKLNAAHIHYIVYFREHGAQWQEVSFPDASSTSYSLTNLDPGMSYQIYVMAVDSSGNIRRSDTSTVRTSNKIIDHDSPKDHGKQLVLYAAATIILVIVLACIYDYSKTSLSATHSNGEGTQKISAEEDNIIKADLPEVAEAVKPEASDSKTRAAETEGPVSIKNLPEDYGFVTDINHLLKENRGIDVTFELETQSGKTEYFAHQLILAVMSSYFADEFYDKGRNKGHNVISLKGINPKAFEQMIKYCYGEKPIFKTTEEACVLFKIASEFKVISLQNLCCNFFKHTKINPRNLFSILEISEETKDKSLKDKCHKILQDKTRDVMASYELYDVTPTMVRIIFDMPRLSLESEYELIKWTFDWVKVKSKDSSCRSDRDYLAELLQNMNFLALTVEEFAMLSKENPKVFNSDERASISLNIACPGSWEMPVWYNKDLKRRVYTR